MCHTCLDHGVCEDVERSIFGHTQWFCDCSIGRAKQAEERRLNELFKNHTQEST